MEDKRHPFDYTANFATVQGKITLTEAGQAFAGNQGMAAHTRGNFLARMAVHMMNSIDKDPNPAKDQDKLLLLFSEVMIPAADAAQPPLNEVDKEAFMAGAREALGGVNQ